MSPHSCRSVTIHGVQGAMCRAGCDHTWSSESHVKGRGVTVRGGQRAICRTHFRPPARWIPGFHSVFLPDGYQWNHSATVKCLGPLSHSTSPIANFNITQADYHLFILKKIILIPDKNYIIIIRSFSKYSWFTYVHLTLKFYYIYIYS